MTNADCPPSGGAPGICGSKRCVGPLAGKPCTLPSQCPGGTCLRTGEATRRNTCLDGVCSPVADGDGVCAGPDEPMIGFCAEVPWRVCASNPDCPYGLCVPALQRCFLDTIARTGVPDPPIDGHAEPTLVATGCVAPTLAAAVNNIFGLPGPVALTLPVRVDFVR